MAKKKDIDTHDLDKDFGADDFNFDDFEENIDSKQNRNPSVFSKKIAGSSAISAVLSGQKKIGQVLSRELPNTAEAFSTATVVASDAMRLKDQDRKSVV